MDWFIWLSKTSLDPSLVYEYGLAFTNNELEEEDIAYFNHEFLQSMGISIAKHRLEILKLARKVPKKHPILSKLVFVLKNTKKSLTHYIATLVHHRHNDDNRALILLPNSKNNNNNYSKNNKVIKSNMSGGALSYSSRWRRSMMMKNNNKKLVMVNSKNNNNNKYTNNSNIISNNNNINNSNEDNLMLTNGDYIGDYLGDDAIVVSTPKLDSYSSPLMYDLQQSKGDKVDDNHHDHDDHGDGDEEDVDDQYWSPTLEEIRWDAMFQDLKPT